MSNELDILKKLEIEIEEYDTIIDSVNRDIEQTDDYEIELRDKLRSRIATLKRGRTEALRVYNFTSELSREFEDISDLDRFTAYLYSINEPYKRPKKEDTE